MQALLPILGYKKQHMLIWVVASLVLALSSACLAFLVGPLLRVVFGGEVLKWSPILSHFFGEPPPISVIKNYLPFLIAICSLLKAISFFIERLSRAHLVRHTARILRQNLLVWGSQLSSDQRSMFGQGDLQHRLTIDVERFESWLDQHGACLVRDSVAVLVLVMSTIALSGYIALAVFSVYPLLIIPMISLNKRLKKAASGQLSTAKVLHRWAQYTEQHLEFYQAQRQSIELQKDLELYQNKLDQDQLSLATLQGVAPSLTEVLVSLIIAFSLYGFTWGLENAWWSAEELMSLFVCILMLYQPIKGLSKAYQQWTYGQIVWQRCLPNTLEDLKAVLSKKQISQQNNQHQPIDLWKKDQSQKLSHVALSIYSIQRGEHNIQLKLNEQLNHSKLYCIKGSNGSGKTSLLKAITHLIPYEGSIVFESMDRIKLPIDHLEIAWFSQPAQIILTEMMDLTSCPRGSTDQLTTFARYLECFKFPQETLDKLLDVSRSHAEKTINLTLWDWFENLSLGEKQKCALCMLFMNTKAQICLLDEPEAHLDTESLVTLVQLLREHSQTRIVILVSHEPYLQDHCDQIIHLAPSH